MATYNGGKYIREQLDSIINQTYVNWKLYIADDCSNDETVDIIKDFISRDNRIEFKINTCRKGACQNFATLLEEHISDGDFFMFSDQDDVWHRKKIEKSVAAITVLNNSQKNKKNITYEIKTDSMVAPIKKGEIVGKISVYEDGSFSYSVDLIVNNDINKANILKVFLRNIKDIIMINI